ncbi:MAG: VOC family protein [Gammaproteobacteria bacterium]|nr:VOC family protein [Gammaproteobacteria bacterium]
MTLAWLDHVNIRTADVPGLVRFYTEILGMVEGERPSFGFNGSWLYCGERAAVHLVESGERPRGARGEIEHGMEHFAFRARGLAGFLERLRRHDVDYELVVVPDILIKQVHIRDPDGNHIEVAFEPHETET